MLDREVWTLLTSQLGLFFSTEGARHIGPSSLLPILFILSMICLVPLECGI